MLHFQQPQANIPLGQQNPFGMIHPTPNPNNHLFYQDYQQQVRNLNVERMVEQTLNRHGFNIGFADKMLFASPFPYEVQAMDMPRGYKIPKFTKFAGELEESTVEHVARFTLECGDLAASELLKMKLFPSSLTKEAFSWFTTLTPNSIRSWVQLERQFHEQFYRGEVRIAIADLSSIRRYPNESIDDYLSRFRKLKSRCPTPIPELELVKMAVRGLDYQVKKKVLDHHIVDMAQLADRVRQVENLYAEKLGHKRIQKNQKIAYIDANEPVESHNDEVEEEVALAELKPGPPYVCKSLYPNAQNNNSKSESWSQKVYGFDISKADLIFDVLVKDKQLLLSQDHKIMTADQLKGRKYCKFHNKIGHTTNSCIRFRDLVQQAIKDGRLKFEAAKAPMKVDTDPLPVEANLVEPEAFEINMVNVTGPNAFPNSRYKLEQFDSFQREIFPQKGELLECFLMRKRNEGKKIALCPRCSAVYDLDAAKVYEQSEFKRSFDTMAGRHKNARDKKYSHLHGQFVAGQSSHLRPEDIPVWYTPTHNQQGGNQRQGKALRYGKVCPNHRYEFSNVYNRSRNKTKYQWRRATKDKPNASTHRLKSEVEVNSYSRGPEIKNSDKGKQIAMEEDVESSKFETGFPDDLQAICNVVSILPLDYTAPVDMVEEEEESFFDEDEGPIVVHNTMPFDMTNAAVFPMPTDEMRSHLKPLFIKAKADDKIIKRVLVDGGAAINLIPERVVEKLGKSNSDIMPHNMVITDFNGNRSKSPGCIALDLKVGSVTRTTMFVIVPSSANYNLLLGREWIHGVGAVPSTMHQMIFLWNQAGRIEFINGDDDYFRCEVNTADFDRNLSNIEPLNVTTKEDFYVDYPAQVQLSPYGLSVEHTHNNHPFPASSDVPGVVLTFFDWNSFFEKESLSQVTKDTVVEFNAYVHPLAHRNQAEVFEMPLPRDKVHYPDIQPTGWDV